MIGLGLSLPSMGVARRSALVVVQVAPLFEDNFNIPGLFSARAGWTIAGDATRSGKMTAADDIARMTGGSNGTNPPGRYITAASSQWRRVTIDYDYSQQGGTLSNPATPYQWYDQRWILAYQDADNYTYCAPSVAPAAGFMQLRLYKRVAAVETELTCRFLDVPWAGTAKLELTDRIRLYVDDKLYIADGLYNVNTTLFPDKGFANPTTAIRDGGSGINSCFHNLCLAKGWKLESLDPLWVADPKPFYGMDTTRARTITFTGTYTGTPVSWAYRLRRRSTGATVKDWAAFTPTFGAGTFSGDITVASGGPYKIDIAWVGADGFARVFTPLHFAVGILIVMWGQSLAVAGSGIGGAPAPSGDDTVIGFNGYATYVGSSWERFVDDTLPPTLASAMLPSMLGVSKRMREALSAVGDNTPVGVAAIGVASNALETLKPGTSHWDNVLVPFIAKLGGYVWQWQLEQGQAECLALSAYGNWSPDFGLCVIGFRDIGGIPTAPVLLRITGKDTSVANNSTTITRSQAVRSIQNSLHNPAAGIRVSCFDIGEPLGDQIHPTPAGNYGYGERDGLSHACAYGAIAYDGRGPMLSTATRSGAVITLPINANGATSFTGSALTGYSVSNDDFATTLTNSSVEIVGGDLVISLAGVPTGTCKVKSFPEPNYADSSLARGVYANGMSIPFFLIADPITVT